MLEADEPQYLQVYFDFSLPSYKTCFPLLGPKGCLEQFEDVSELILEAFDPQFWQ